MATGGAYPIPPVVADFNGDGKQDLAFSAYTGVGVVLGRGDGTFGPVAIYPAGPCVDSILAGEFNGDGFTDLLIDTCSGVILLTGIGDGSFRAPITAIPDAPNGWLAAADFDGDGTLDIAVAVGMSVYIYRGRGNGGFFAAVTFGLDSSVNSIVTADFNSDGKADIAVGLDNGAATSHGVAVLLGKGDGGFLPPIYSGFSPGRSIVTGDFNGDGQTDLAVTSFYPYEITVFFGSGDGRFPTHIGTGINASVFTAADFNADGISDIAAYDGSTLNVFLGHGDGGFNGPARYLIPLGVSCVTPGEFNGDGQVDLVTMGGAGINVLSSFSSPRARLGISVSHTGDVRLGGTVTYSITVSNSAGADRTARTVVVTDQAGPDQGLKTISGPGWTCMYNACSRSDPLDPGASYPPITTIVNVGAFDMSPSQIVHRVFLVGGSSLPATAVDTAPSLPSVPTLFGSGVSPGAPLGGFDLIWLAYGADTYDLYFGTSSPPPLLASAMTASRYALGQLPSCATYYWRVISHNGAGQTSSDVASFTTTARVALNPTSGNLPATGGSASVSVTTADSCTWNVTSISGATAVPTSGRGNGSVSYSLPPNGSFSPVETQITIGDQQFNIHQEAGPACPMTLGSIPILDASAQTVSMDVHTDSGCNWAFNPYASWFSFEPNSGTGSATVNLKVAANGSGTGRTDQFGVFVPHGTGPLVSITQRQTVSTFADVPPDNMFFDAINLLYGHSITNGCSGSPLRYCPDDNIPRGQMAVFLVRSVMGGDNFSYSTTPYFTDVPASHQFFKWIQKLRELGITNGCTATQYCPEDSVTRGQTAAFIIRARFGPTAPFTYPSAPQFTDVPSGHPFFTWIQKMGQIGITSGCTATQYCPDDPVTRGQMAVFVMRGEFNQLLPPYTPALVSISPAAASAGQTINVTITGVNTAFTSGTPQITAGDGITANWIAAPTLTTLTATFAVSPTAAPGPRSVTVSGFGPLEATLPNGFRVQ